MIKKIVLFLSIAAMLLSACASARAPASTLVQSYDKSSQGAVPAEAPRLTVGGQTEAVSNSSGYSAPAPTIERIVIKNANLSIAVDDPPKSMENITQLAESLGGFVVSAQLSQTHLDSGAEVPQASITIRVPAEKLNEALAQIKTETKRPVISEEMTSQDVTKEYTDLQSRLTNLQAAESQLKEIMASATKTEDVLNVYNQLTQVREQIEVIKGQIQYYEQSAALSAISVQLLANEAVQPLSIGGWQPVGVAKQALQALINTLKGLATAGIWLVLLVIPVLFVILLPFYLLFLLIRALRRRYRKPKTPPAPTPTA
jgi:hypothetical protein